MSLGLGRRTPVYPPLEGHRMQRFSGLDDLFWTTPEGDITSYVVTPPDSLWLSFKNAARLGRGPSKKQRFAQWLEEMRARALEESRNISLEVQDGIESTVTDDTGANPGTTSECPSNEGDSASV